ncbi:MAG: M64 family metallopeptidase [Candidatus Cryptobacteroides sp.]
MKRIVVLLLAFAALNVSYAANRTLRVDYIFSGTARTAEIALDEMSVFDGWAGRSHNLDSVALKGNGQICMRDAASGKVLYRQSFSTLFQEWQTTEEAVSVRKSFENVFLLPMPQEKAVVRVELYDFHGAVQASFEHPADPDDILVRRLPASPVPHRMLLESGPATECIDIAIVAEGYTAAEAEIFYADAKVAMDEILSYEPFATFRDRFNFVAVAAPSNDSGVSVPAEGDWKDTALCSHFSTFYSDRYLTTLRLRRLHDLLAGIPYEHIIILANTDTYGGGGIYNSYTLTTAHHASFKPVVVHEFGHSFAGLADEYYYDDQYSDYYFPDEEPWEQNITTMCDFASKWGALLPEGAKVPFEGEPCPKAEMWKRIADGEPAANFVGVYEGGGYLSKGVWRPYPDCRMHTNEAPVFCPVCQNAIRNLIEFYID